MLKTYCERLKTEKVKVRSEDVSSTKRSKNFGRNNQENGKNVSASEKAENQSTEKNKRKPKIFLVGDSMVRDIKGWLLSRNKTVKVHTFPGSTTEDIESFLIPLLKRKPDQILLHVGTNDLKSYSP